MWEKLTDAEEADMSYICFLNFVSNMISLKIWKKLEQKYRGSYSGNQSGLSILIFFLKKSHKYIERLKPKTNQDSKHHFPEMWQLEWLFFCAAHRKRDSGLLSWAFAYLQIVRQCEGGRAHLPAFLRQSPRGFPRGAPFPVLLLE